MRTFFDKHDLNVSEATLKSKKKTLGKILLFLEIKS